MQRLDPAWRHKPRRLPRDDGLMRTNAAHERQWRRKTTPKQK